MTEIKKFDAIIIGSGQAGTPLAFKLASQGQKVAFIESALAKPKKSSKVDN